MNVWNGCRCISFYFIIKPQPSLTPSAMRYVVYHSISSSNHNYWTYHRRTFRLYIILFHHQTTTPQAQPSSPWPLYIILFHHQTTTETPATIRYNKLYIILFHHQTTTPCLFLLWHDELYIILFHHQTTTPGIVTIMLTRCISFYFIIKPQREADCSSIR